MKITFLLFISFIVNAAIFPNFHTVHKGEVYRSAQLSKKQFERYINKYNIKTIINLRGESQEDWYKEEIEISKELDVDHFDIRMRAKRLPHREDLLKLIDLFETARRPILIHCHGGADRTGEAAAMYKIDFMNASKKKAMKMQRLRYGHIKVRFPAKRYFIKNVYQGKEWAKESYYPCDSNYRYYDKNSKECATIDNF